MLECGSVLDINEVPSKDWKNEKSIGWVSYRCKDTMEKWVSRISGNKLEDYVYRG